MYVKVRFITHYLNEYLEKFMQFCTYIRTILRTNATMLQK